jgi:hypothetical protein
LPVFPNIDELRQYVDTDLPDEVLETYALDADAAIVDRYGPNFEDVTEPITIIVKGGFPLLVGLPQSSTIDEIREDGVVLVAGTDYQVFPWQVERLPLGRYWAKRVEVDVLPLDDTEQRKRVAAQLIQLNLIHGQATTRRVGDLQVSGLSMGDDFNQERERILRSLRPEVVIA